MTSSLGKKLFLGSVAMALIGGISQMAFADKLCLKAQPSGKKIKLTKKIVTTAKCPSGYTLMTDTALFQGPQGAQGATGATGADGQMRVYGDGSAGAKVVSTSENLATISDANNAPNLQFTDVTINSGVTWTVPSGTVIRCTGTFTNNGTIAVSSGAYGELLGGDTSNGIRDQGASPANAGVSARAAGHGDFGDSAVLELAGGSGGVQLNSFVASQLTYPGPYGGGGGGAGGQNSCSGLFGSSYTSHIGSAGGGSLVVLAEGGIVNNGTIAANGDNGKPIGLVLFGCPSGGGGGGGVVVLASKTAITNASGAKIYAKGGTGADPDSSQAASGGGGGGVIRLIATNGVTVASAADLVVDGGTGGSASAAGSIGGAPSWAGGGGGACGGYGGDGGDIATDQSTTAGENGQNGVVYITKADPTGLF